jgi:hypothetical protein
MAKPYIQNVPVPYMDLQTLWNDRRDPHANPMGSSPRREGGRASVPSGLHKLVNQIYRGAPGKDADSGPSRDQIVNERLYTSGRKR